MDNLINFERYYDVFRDISRIVHASVDVEEVLELVAWKSAEMFGAQGACLRIINLHEMRHLFGVLCVCQGLQTKSH